ncbi:MAG: T9SS type A sorting domain-containing protein [Bacteroidetes bacterium]|nr:T9SS type A sorting domain-containing protein [Bacteroidota bacterium]MCL2301874.1 T9SS type A sorting domain-containing protein [Lentimicrobiaceae bacterium]
MKKTLLFTCLIAIFIFQGKAQEDWLCVYSDKKVYFEDRNNLVYCIRIDSTFNDNTILYPFSDLHQIDWDCYSVTSGSWLSKYIVIDDEGNTFFVNGKNQLIFIKSQAALHEIWEVFANDDIKVIGEITSIASKSILGVEDLVKTVKFSVFDMNAAPINHILNQRSLEISKHFGLIKTVSFYNFEYQYWTEEFDLIGINEPQLGFKPINLKEDYFDFQAGDEFHIYYAFKLGIPYPLYEYKTIHRYLSRTDYEDRIEYYYERKINTATPKDTVKQVITKGVFFTTEPNEPYVDENYFDGAIAKVMIKNSPLPKMYIHDYLNESLVIIYSDEPCLEFLTADGCFSAADYYPGLGGPYYECCDMWGSKYCYELVYYKKGDTEVGTPFNLPVVEYEKEMIFSIYPNPASDYITIKSAKNELLNDCTIEVYDIYGRNVGAKRVLPIDGRINVSHLQAGCYIVKVLRENKAPVSVKMIKQ